MGLLDAPAPAGTGLLDTPGDFGLTPQNAMGLLGAWLNWRNQNAAATSRAFQDMTNPDLGHPLSPETINFGAGFIAPIKAFHGSPYDFSAFDSSKIGTGEGAQAYGHGLYFAENEGVARSYRDNLAKPSFIETKSGVPISPTLSRMLEDGYNDAASQGIRGPSFNDAVFLAQKNLEGQRAAALGAQDMDWFSKVADLQSELHRVSKDAPAPSGRMYEVQINAEPHQLLDWDRPLSEQPALAQKIPQANMNEPAGAVLQRAYRNPLFAGDLIGADRASPQELSAALAQRGIPGIQYLDGGSRAAGDGTRNFVIFDPSLVSIVRKYGLLGPTAAGAGYGLLGGDNR